MTLVASVVVVVVAAVVGDDDVGLVVLLTAESGKVPQLFIIPAMGFSTLDDHHHYLVLM